MISVHVSMGQCTARAVCDGCSATGPVARSAERAYDDVQRSARNLARDNAWDTLAGLYQPADYCPDCKSAGGAP